MPETWRKLGPGGPLNLSRSERPQLLRRPVPCSRLAPPALLPRWVRGSRASCCDLQEGTWLPRMACATHPGPGKAGPEVSARRGWEEGGGVVDGQGSGSQPSAWQETCSPSTPLLLLRVGLRGGDRGGQSVLSPHGSLFYFPGLLASLAASGKVIRVPFWPWVRGSGCPRPLIKPTKHEFWAVQLLEGTLLQENFFFFFPSPR